MRGRLTQGFGVHSWRVARANVAAARVLAPNVLNAKEDLDAVLVQIAAEQAQLVAVPAPIAVAQVRTFAAQAQIAAEQAPIFEVPAQTVEAADRTVVEVHSAAAFPRVPRELPKVRAHASARVDLVLGRGFRFARGVQVGRCDLCPQAAGFVPDVPADHFGQGDLFSQSAKDVQLSLRVRLLPVWCQ
jgi:hypothetical protein